MTKMTKNNQWLNWLKCNVLEIVILILVLLLLVKAYSAPAVEEVPVITEEVSIEAPEEPFNIAEEASPVEEASEEEIPKE